VVITLIIISSIKLFLRCWVTTENGGMWEWVSYYVPVMLVTACAVIILLIIIVKTNSHVGSRQSQINLWHNLIGIFVLFTGFCIMFTHRVYEKISNDNSFSFELLHACVQSSFGILCFYTFGFTQKNLQAISSWWNTKRLVVNSRDPNFSDESLISDYT